MVLSTCSANIKEMPGGSRAIKCLGLASFSPGDVWRTSDTESGISATAMPYGLGISERRDIWLWMCCSEIEQKIVMVV